ncbi:hypothetical protein VTL71DRAFT_5391 [Oculimacula yallundae]|uniref:Uncharacterized protein n=1 Tax=Oculimacula yallundae TaxID=86028 RepID=A0ABR4C2I4_9HELO
MEILDPSLGTLSILPPELRTMIWRKLSPTLHIARSLPRKPNHLSPNQAILLTSRKIYVEVAAEIPSGYNDNAITISVLPEYKHKSWIRARNTKRVQWEFEDLQDATSRGFCDLPWHELRVRIWIAPPERNDSAQIICLYKKVRALVEVLKKAKGFRSLWVYFKHTKDTSWFDDARPQCSIEKMAHLLPWELGIRGAKWDYEFIFPMFLQIQNVKVAKISSSEIIEGKQEYAIMNMNHKFAKGQEIMSTFTINKAQNKSVYYHGIPIQVHLDAVFLRMERMLDDYPSNTANMLRLERFSSWYTDKLHGKSPYEDELKRMLLAGMNGLSTMTTRYRIMRAHNPLSLAYRSAFRQTLESYKHLDITDARGWSKEAWHCVYRNGILPLESKEIDQVYRKWGMEHDDPENGGEYQKLYHYFSLLIGMKPVDVNF